MGVVALLLVTFSLHTSANRWRDLQLQLEERKEAHRQEMATLQLKFKTKCGSSDKAIAALAGTGGASSVPRGASLLYTLPFTRSSRARLLLLLASWL